MPVCTQAAGFSLHSNANRRLVALTPMEGSLLSGTWQLARQRALPLTHAGDMENVPLPLLFSSRSRTRCH